MPLKKLLALVAITIVCLNSTCSAKEILMNGSDDDESEIDKIYKKHKKLDELLQFNQVYANAVKSGTTDETYIDQIQAKANAQRDQGHEIEACALYLAVATLWMHHHELSKEQQGKLLDSLKSAVKIALKHDTRLQGKLLEVFKPRDYWMYRRTDSLGIQNQVYTELLSIAGELDDKKPLLEVTSQVARVKHSEKKYEEAITLYKKCIELTSQLEGGSSRSSSAYFDSLQAIYKEQGNSEAASALIKDRIAFTVQNETAPLSLEKLIQLQELYLQDGKFELAADTLKKTAIELEKQLNKQMISTDPFRRASMFPLDSSISSSLRFLRKLEDKGVKANDLHEKLLRMQYQSGKQERDHWFADKIKALTTFLIGNGKAAEAVAILKVEISDQKGKVHPHHLSNLESAYLSALQAAKMTREYNAIMAERALEQKKKEAEQAKALEISFELSRSKLKVEPNSFFHLAVEVLTEQMRSNNYEKAAQLKREIHEAYRAVPKEQLDAASLMCVWSLSHIAIPSEKMQAAQNLKLERELVEASEKLIAKLDQDDYGHSRDLAEQVHRYSHHGTPEERIDFLNFVIALRKKYNPENKERLQQAYEWLVEEYSQSENLQKEKETREQLLSILQSQNPSDKTPLLEQEIEITAASVTPENAEQTLKKLLGYFPEIAKSKQHSQYGLVSKLSKAFCNIAETFSKSGEIAKAQNVLKLERDAARTHNIALPYYEQNQILDSITTTLLAKSDFSGAEANMELKISMLKSGQKLDDSSMIDLGDSMVRLSETLLAHSRTVAAPTDGQRLSDLSAKHLKDAIEVYKNCKSDFALWSIGWAQRRHAFAVTTGKNPDEFHRYEPLNANVRHHREDVPNQLPGRPPQPLECAVVARSYAEIGAGCLTEIVDLSKGPIENAPRGAKVPSLSRSGSLIVSGSSSASANSGDAASSRKLTGPEVFSNGTTILHGSARVPATVGGRSIVMTGGSIKVLGDLNANSDIPDPFPWVSALVPPGSSKVVPVVIEDGKIEAAPAGCIADLGDFILTGKSMKIEAGDYLISKMRLLNGAILNIERTPESHVPVRFFVKDIKPEDSFETQILIDDAVVNQNGKPADMQFWCIGEGLVLLKGSKIRSTIYAPKAPIIVSASELVGALAADEVRLKNATKIAFDIALPSPQELGLARLEVPPPTDSQKIEGGGGGSISSTGARPDENFRARSCIESGEYDDAIKCYTDALLKLPTVQNYIGRGYCYFRTGQFEKALADCKIAIANEPEYAFAHAICGLIYQKQGEAQKAKLEYTTAIALCPIDEDMDDLLFLAICQAGSGNPDKGIEILTEALAVTKSDPELYLFRAEFYDSQGKSELASEDRLAVKELYKKAVEKRQREKEALERYMESHPGSNRSDSH